MVSESQDSWVDQLDAEADHSFNSFRLWSLSFQRWGHQKVEIWWDMFKWFFSMKSIFQCCACPERLQETVCNFVALTQTRIQGLGMLKYFKHINLFWNALPRQRLVGVQGIPLNIQVEGMVFGHTTSGLRTQVASGAWWFDLTMIDHSSWRIVVFCYSSLMFILIVIPPPWISSFLLSRCVVLSVAFSNALMWFL